MARITDPLLEPYFIGKDTYCYTVYESVAPKKTRAGTVLKEVKPERFMKNPKVITVLLEQLYKK